MATRMAEHYAVHPAVIGWQIDNEFGERCYCPRCQGVISDLAAGTLRTLEEVNRRWGTVFWSHEYTTWEQIPLPLSSGASPNPGLALDFARFASDSYVAFQKLQVENLRRSNPIGRSRTTSWALATTRSITSTWPETWTW